MAKEALSYSASTIYTTQSTTPKYMYTQNPPPKYYITPNFTVSGSNASRLSSSDLPRPLKDLLHEARVNNRRTGNLVLCKALVDVDLDPRIRRAVGARDRNTGGKLAAAAASNLDLLFRLC